MALATVSAHDVAKYILDHCAPMTGMKLQKLLYYSQAWSLVWENVPLFDEDIEAWPKGPVIRDIYNAHGGDATVSEWEQGDTSKLSDVQKKTINSVIKTYAPMTAGVLSGLTHDEAPWVAAIESVKGKSRSGRSIISHESMRDYYSSL